MRAHRQFGAILCALAMMPGCDSDSPSPRLRLTGVAADPIRVLLSEVTSASDRRAILPTDFQIENRSPQSMSLTLMAKSCNCYSVLIDGELLDINGTLVLPPRATRQARLDVAAPAEPGHRHWNVRFRAQPSGSGEPVDLPLRIGVEVIDDVRIEPNVLVARAHSPSTLQARARIIHTSRSGSPAAPPRIQGLPDGSDVRLTAEEPVEDGTLHKRAWLATVTFAGDSLSSRSLHSFDVMIDGGPDKPSQVATGRILRNEAFGVTVPAMVHFGRMAIGETASRRVAAVADDGCAFRITAHVRDVVDQETAGAAANSSPRIRFNSTNPAVQQMIDVEWTLTETGPQAAEIQLRTDHPRTPTLRLNVRAEGMEDVSEKLADQVAGAVE